MDPRRDIEAEGQLYEDRTHRESLRCRSKLRADRLDLAAKLGSRRVALWGGLWWLEAADESARRAVRKIMHAPYAISSFTVSTAYRTVFDQNQPPLASKASFTDPAFGTTSDVCRLCTRRVGP